MCKPCGRLTLAPGMPKTNVDQVGKSVLWYSPVYGGTFPLLQSGVWTQQSFLSGPTDQNGWSLGVASIGNYHVYGTSSGLVLGSAWTDPVAELTRYDGVPVNAATQATWLGSVKVGSNGLTCHVSMGQDRRWDVYNAYHREEIRLRVTADTEVYYCPTNQYPAWQPFNNNPLNRATVFTAQPEAVDVSYCQNTFINTQAGPYGIISVVGWNGAGVGTWNTCSSDTSLVADPRGGIARYTNPAAVGLNTATMFVAAAANSANHNSVVYGSFPVSHPTNPELDCQMIVAWKG